MGYECLDLTENLKYKDNFAAAYLLHSLHAHA